MKFNKLAAFALAASIITVPFSSCKGNSSDEGNNGTTPSGFDYSEVLTDDGFFKSVKASDYVTLPDYKGVTIPASVFVASDEYVQEQIDGILANQVGEMVTDRAVADGDTINIDYVGKVGGIEFENGSTNGEGTEVTIGVTSYIDDFLEQLVGHNPGETFDIEVTFPDPYHNEELSGKDAVFTVTINYIQDKSNASALTDEIASAYGFESKEALVDDIKSWILSMQKVQFFSELFADVECSDIPQPVLDYIINEEIAYFEKTAESYGMDTNSFAGLYLGYDTLDEYIESQSDSFKQTATNYIIVQAIAEQESLTVTDEDITKAGFDDYIEVYGRGYVKLYILGNEIVPSFVADNAVVSE